MSYDVSLSIDTGAGNQHEVYDWNFTSNVAPMLRAAGADLAGLDGKTAGYCAPILDAAIERMAADPETFQAMDAPNGWGTYEQLLPALRELLEAMQAHPATTVWVSR